MIFARIRNAADPALPSIRLLCLVLLTAACGTATAGGIYDLEAGRESALITAGPKLMFGTKCPSITS